MNTVKNVNTFEEVASEWKTCLASSDPVIVLRACAHALAYAGLITRDAHMEIVDQLPCGDRGKTRL
jgi:hypothetical protein